MEEITTQEYRAILNTRACIYQYVATSLRCEGLVEALYTKFRDRNSGIGASLRECPLFFQDTILNKSTSVIQTLSELNIFDGDFALIERIEVTKSRIVAEYLDNLLIDSIKEPGNYYKNFILNNSNINFEHDILYLLKDFCLLGKHDCFQSGQSYFDRYLFIFLFSLLRKEGKYLFLRNMDNESNNYTVEWINSLSTITPIVKKLSKPVDDIYSRIVESFK